MTRRPRLLGRSVRILRPMPGDVLVVTHTGQLDDPALAQALQRHLEDLVGYRLDVAVVTLPAHADVTLIHETGP